MPENWQVATTSQVVWILKKHWMCCIVSAFTVKLAVAIVDWGFINCVVVLLVVLYHVIQQQYDTWSPEENDMSKRLNSNLILWVHGPSQNLICYCVPLYIGLQDPIESSLHFSKILMNSKNSIYHLFSSQCQNSWNETQQKPNDLYISSFVNKVWSN